ncbi:hypothetical protein [Flavobacterium yafengii]|uniref:hypothetical protein n=1 Tax=Flavobacterium yafengii TaxID=3041253 RepID=UPI0024A9307E|nr:hypothetical protein [Flavobacterium yafengii]MDI6047533.1 hypothetical protein [Flavobacterium yafengii]
MKSIIISLFLFISLQSYSQTTSEKWNSMYNRYDYTDVNGNLVGYKGYNSLTESWEYTSIKLQNQKTIPYNPYGNNLQLINETLSIKQNRYDNNITRVHNFLNSIRDQLNNSTLDKNLIQKIKNRFNSEYINVYNNKSYDLSSNTTTNNVIQWLKNGYDRISDTEIRNLVEAEEALKEKEEASKIEVDMFKKRYGGYSISKIEEFAFIDKKWVKIKTEENIGYVYYAGTMIYFKKSYTSSWLFRQLIFDRYDTALKSYWYTSQYGETTIDVPFTTVIFYESTNYMDKKYVYTLGKFDKNIKL